MAATFSCRMAATKKNNVYRTRIPHTNHHLLLAHEPFLLAYEPLLLAYEPLLLAYEPLLLAQGRDGPDGHLSRRNGCARQGNFTS